MAAAGITTTCYSGRHGWAYNCTNISCACTDAAMYVGWIHILDAAATEDSPVHTRMAKAD